MNMLLIFSFTAEAYDAQNLSTHGSGAVQRTRAFSEHEDVQQATNVGSRTK